MVNKFQEGRAFVVGGDIPSPSKYSHSVLLYYFWQIPLMFTLLQVGRV